ncbi:MAG: ribbon-helix-helix protein, CopG family [Puniceicoccales bacterium]|jgi:chemotaxis protein histidine kinase CheA|nr:ribbon-helix-helix protein, CopG family [Puniceicoccales bacterium]
MPVRSRETLARYAFTIALPEEALALLELYREQHGFQTITSVLRHAIRIFDYSTLGKVSFRAMPQVSVRLGEKTRDKLTRHAIRTGITVADIIRTALQALPVTPTPNKEKPNMADTKKKTPAQAAAVPVKKAPEKKATPPAPVPAKAAAPAKKPAAKPTPAKAVPAKPAPAKPTPAKAVPAKKPAVKAAPAPAPKPEPKPAPAKAVPAKKPIAKALPPQKSPTKKK